MLRGVLCVCAVKAFHPIGSHIVVCQHSSNLKTGTQFPAFLQVSFAKEKPLWVSNWSSSAT